MKNRWYEKSIVFCMFLMLVFAVFVIVQMNVSADDFADGSGTESDPYQISNVDQLQNMNLHLDAHYVLVNDIDASKTRTWNWNGTAYQGFKPIALDTDPSTISFQGTKFTGRVYGNGKVIHNLYINRSTL